MSIPKTTRFTLKRIVENLGKIPDNGFGDKPKQLTPEQKKRLMEMASMYETYGQAIQSEDAIVNSAKALTELCELAELYALNECGDVFQRNIMEKDMKEVKKRVMEYTKIAKECYARMQQLGVAYQDIGHILGRYYDLSGKSAGSTVTPNKQQSSGKKPLEEGDSVCAWCNTVLKKDSIAGEHPTHGICDKCKDEFTKGMDSAPQAKPQKPPVSK